MGSVNQGTTYAWNSRKRKYRAHILMDGSALCQSNTRNLDASASTAPASRQVCRNCKAVQAEIETEAGAVLVTEISHDDGTSLAVFAARGDGGPSVLLRRYYSKGGFRRSLFVDVNDVEAVSDAMKTAAIVAAKEDFREAALAMTNDVRRSA